METLYRILYDVRPDGEFKNSRDFIKDGYLDSFDIINLVCELNQTYNIDIDGMDIIIDNFCTIDGICNLILKSGGKIE